VRKKKLYVSILASQLTILVITMLIGFALFVYQEQRRLETQYEQKALVIALTVAADDQIRQAIEYPSGAGDTVPFLAERYRQQLGAAYVVVIDANGIRHSHPDATLIGHRIDGLAVGLDGQTHTMIDNGSIGVGRSLAGTAPLFGPTGTLVGQVAVGFPASAVAGQLLRESSAFALYAASALAIGVIASLALARRLKRSTFGLELNEIASLLSEREAMLHGMREGVIAFDPTGRVKLINDEARVLLDCPPDVVGRRLDDLMPGGRLRDVLSGEISGLDQTVLTDEHCLVANRMPVTVKGRELGAIVTLRDRTELEGVLRELDNVRRLTDALRAQQHEYSNRMHTIVGLLDLGLHQEAFRFATDAESAGTELAAAVQRSIGSPLVAGLVLAKTAAAAERGVQLVLTDDSWLGDVAGNGQTLLTVIGNLVDNAVEAAAGTSPGRVTLHLAENQDTVTVQVGDSGPGILPTTEEIFRDGFSTKAPRADARRGLGLALVNRLVQRLGGEIDVSRGPGAVFTVVLPICSPSARVEI
jgi:two-component system, CitB family, sensor kinase